MAALEREALAAFRGYRGFERGFTSAYENVRLQPTADENQSLAQFRELIAQAQADLTRLHKQPLLRLVRYWGIWLLLALCAFPVAFALKQLGHESFTYPIAAGVAAAIFGSAFLLRYIGRRQAAPLAVSLSANLAKARTRHTGCQEQVEAHYQGEIKRLQDQFRATTEAMDQELKRALAKAGESRVSIRMRSDEKAVRAAAHHERLHQARARRLEQEHPGTLQRLRLDAGARRQAILAASQEREQGMTDQYEAELHAICRRSGSRRLQPVYETIDGYQRRGREAVPALGPALLENLDAARRSSRPAANSPAWHVDVEKLCERHAQGPAAGVARARRDSPCRSAWRIRSRARSCSRPASTGHDEAIGALNNIILRLLATAPPGRLNFTILDPVGLGQNFAGIMHLADYEEQIINSRIWTQSGQIEQKLADLNEHMEKVIQMYLRNEYATIAEYNEQAGVIAEKYYFLVVADFPANFTETAAKRLLSIAASGARCGVYMLIHWDQRQPLPPEFIPDELRASSVCLSGKGNQFLLAGKPMPGTDLALDAPPPPEFAIEFVNKVGLASRDSSRVEVPFAHVAPPEAEIWTRGHGQRAARARSAARARPSSNTSPSARGPASTR